MPMTNHYPHILVLELAMRALACVAFDMNSTLASVELMIGYLLIKEKLKKNLKLITLEDHQ